MCDTLGFIGNGKSLFAKNSDRSPNEAQILEYIPSRKNEERYIKATYITVPQVEMTHAVLLSRPTWLWGAEIGVNDCGVCIGNEAVWTKGKYAASGLTGMDMLRLALERSDSARNALGVLTEVLEKYGQGGNCGYDHSFFYDNSFLVMDRNDLFVLETSDKEWVWKKYDKASISNRLSIGDDGDRYSTGSACDFSKRHSDILYNFASGSKSRKCQTECALRDDMTVKDMFAALRTHNSNVNNPFEHGTVTSACMHYGGIVGDHTTASMVADIKDDKTIVWATGCSLPCISLFKPWIFGEKPNFAMMGAEKYWYKCEQIERSFIGKIIPEEFYLERNEIEDSWMKKVDANDNDVFAQCFDQEKVFFERWQKEKLDKAKCTPMFSKRWEKKNNVLRSEMTKIV